MSLGASRTCDTSISPPFSLAVYHVLLRLKSQLSRGDFFRIVQFPPSDANASSSSSHLHLASSLLEVYARAEDRELLRDFYYQDDRRTESAVLSLEEAERETDMTERVFKIKEAQKLFGEDKDRALEAKVSGFSRGSDSRC